MSKPGRIRLAAWLAAQRERPNRVIAALLIGAVGLRAMLGPVLGDKAAYSLLFPIVLVTAYLYGPKRATLVAGISAGLGLVLFADPLAGWTAARAALAGMAFYVINCAAVIYLVGAMTAAAHDLKAAQGRSEALANTQADLFREVNGRITHHLRLVAGVLALQAEGEPEPKVSAGLRKAAERSRQISRAHAELAGRETDSVPFEAICKRIVQALVEAAGEPPGRVQVSSEIGFSLDPEAATSLAAAILECLSAALKLKPEGPVAVHLVHEYDRTSAQIVIADGRIADRLRALADGFLLQAVIDQLGADLRLIEGRGQAALEVVFRSEERTAPQAVLQQTLH